MENQNPNSTIEALSRIRSAAAIAKAESSKRSIGDVVVSLAFGAEAEAVSLHWSRQDGMGHRDGRIPVPWDELANAQADPLIAALRRGILAVSGSTS